eukprot:4065820-Prymnesium_polylepis.1
MQSSPSVATAVHEGKLHTAAPHAGKCLTVVPSDDSRSVLPLRAPDHQVCDRPPPTDILCTDAWCAGERPVNRMSRPNASINKDGQRMDVEEPATVTQTEQPPPILRWKVGVEVPPLVRENAAAVALVASILSGTIVEWPPIGISEAVAVLIYRLLLDKQRRAAQFAASTWADVYVVLASLARRECVATDAAAAKKLSK